MKKDTVETQETGALTRFRAVNHIEEMIRGGGSLADALREAALRPWPDESGRCFAVRTLEDWIYAYRKGGFPALQTQERVDKGTWHSIDEKFGVWLMEQVTRSPKLQVTVLYDHWKAQGMALPSKRSVYRYLERQGLSRSAIRAGRLETGPTKTFEASAVNELWMVDFSPGPTLRLGEKVTTTHLCVLLDDYSRLITFAGYYPAADTASFHQAFKEAVQRRGLPRKLYTDRGGPFTNTHTRLACANLGVRLLHAKPYHAWSKGKVERVIQTIQKGFEATLVLEGNRADSIEDLNHKLSVWIQTVYHNRVHGTTGATPLTRYQQGSAAVRRLDGEVKLDELFYTRLARKVRKDGTVRIKKALYEVDLSLRALAVELRFDPVSLKKVEVWHQGRFVGLARRANVTFNGESGGSRLYGKA
jgi:transposase InsO family protein